jgi:hypothetical protein
VSAFSLEVKNVSPRGKERGGEGMVMDLPHSTVVLAGTVLVEVLETVYVVCVIVVVMPAAARALSSLRAAGAGVTAAGTARGTLPRI